MSAERQLPDAQFDTFAENYDRALAEGISVSGEDKNYFAQGRIEWLAKLLQSLRFAPERILDFGCGTGSAVPLLLNLPGVRSIVGIDVSAKSLEVARKQFASERVQ